MAAPRGKVPASAIIGLLGMVVVGSWGVVEHRERSASDLGGRRPIPAPAWAAAEYADVCAKARRCSVAWPAIRWFVVDSTALPAVICPSAVARHTEVWGCWEWGTRALTLARSVLADTVVVRHELMHAALGAQYSGQHPCRFFSVAQRTLHPGQPCNL